MKPAGECAHDSSTQYKATMNAEDIARCPAATADDVMTGRPFSKQSCGRVWRSYKSTRAEQGRSRPIGPRQGRAGQDGQGRAGQGQSAPGRAGQVEVGQSKAGQGKDEGRGRKRGSRLSQGWNITLK